MTIGNVHYVPVRWIKLENVHDENNLCRQSACVIHNPSGHHMQYWPLHWRDDRGMFERICDHGVGHPDPDQYPYWESAGMGAEGVHGCCHEGCCLPPRKERVVDDE